MRKIIVPPPESPAVIVSFFTPEPYYSQAAGNLRNACTRLGIASEIYKDDSAGRDWIQLTRRKFHYMNLARQKFPLAKIFWLDVDSVLLCFPVELIQSSADFIGIKRGEGSHIQGSYTRFTRYWSPAFWGVNFSSARGREFFEAAYLIEARTRNNGGTDDWVLEEAWRSLGGGLLTMTIPVQWVGQARGASFSDQKPFISHGHSGNVAHFRALALQQEKPHQAKRPSALRRFLRFYLSRATAYLSRATASLLGRNRARRILSFLQSMYLKGFIPIKRRHRRIEIHALAPGVQRAVQRANEALESGARPFQVDSAMAALRPFSGFRSAEGAFGERINAFDFYLSRKSKDPIRLFWLSQPVPGNFGDWLSPLAVSRLSGASVAAISHQQLRKTPHIIGVGSIAKFAQPNSVIWGAGFSAQDQPANADASWMSVRGPISSAIVKKTTGCAPAFQGDPGLLLRRLISKPRPPIPNGRVALVRHYAHRELHLPLPPNWDELDVRVAHPDMIEELVTRLLQYSLVVTSSLHIVILCVSYGIPFTLVSWSQKKMSGDGMKYSDFSQSLGLGRLEPKAVGQILDEDELKSHATSWEVPNSILDTIEDSFEMAIEKYWHLQPTWRVLLT